MSTEPQYLTIEQTAEYLNVTVRAIRNWIAFGKIEHVKMGKYIRFRKEYLGKWVEKNTVKAKKVA
jgi:excisionase family DNA binding protein